MHTGSKRGIDSKQDEESKETCSKHTALYD